MNIRRVRRLSAPVCVAIAAGASLGASGAGARAGEDHVLSGVRATPEVPVRSGPLRGAPSHHPLQPPGGKRPKCDKDIDTSSGAMRGLTHVAAQDNQVCTTADIDTYKAGADTYVVQAGGEEAAHIHTLVSNPAAPARFGPFRWARRGGKNTYTPDVKAFSQTVGGQTRRYIALSLERIATSGFCGVVIVDVTAPANPSVVTQIYKNDPSDFWCDVHNSFVEAVAGEGRYLYLTADARSDMRVVDIANVADLPNPCNVATSGCDREVGRYITPGANSDNYVHDVTVIDHGGDPPDRRAYLSYWDTGLVVLDADDVAPDPTPGTNPTPIATVDPPSPFSTHHAFASADGTYVFLQDEFLDQSGEEPVQMWTLDKDPANAIFPEPEQVDGLALGSDVPGGHPAHNLEIRFDLDPDRLYVGWYKLGLQAWDFTAVGFTRSFAFDRTAVQYHQAQTESNDDKYDGAWGVRMEDIGSCRYFFQSDRRYGLIVDKNSSSC